MPELWASNWKQMALILVYRCLECGLENTREVLRIRLLTTVENGGVGRLKLVALGY